MSSSIIDTIERWYCKDHKECMERVENIKRGIENKKYVDEGFVYDESINVFYYVYLKYINEKERVNMFSKRISAMNYLIEKHKVTPIMKVIK